MPKKYRYSEIFRSIPREGFHYGAPTIWYRAWSKGFDHLAYKDTAEDICKKLRSFLPGGTFRNYHMAFTGDDSMTSQLAIADIMRTFRLQWDDPKNVTIETNGTQMPIEEFVEVFTNTGLFPGKLFWSCSPELCTSGKTWEEAIKPDVLWQYHLINKKGQLKYVVDGTDKCWDKVEKVTELYREAGVTWPVFIMPMGATVKEQQKICEQTLDRGYNFSARNKIGT